MFATLHITAQTTTLALLKRNIVVVPCRCFARELIYHSSQRHGVVCALYEKAKVKKKIDIHIILIVSGMAS
ncbi:MAG: hypothetical protein HY800_06630 [Ignavibacteriales bacterium]|nr:hypothetical protein [Ignavibacteriales bacterium]